MTTHPHCMELVKYMYMYAYLHVLMPTGNTNVYLYSFMGYQGFKYAETQSNSSQQIKRDWQWVSSRDVYIASNLRFKNYFNFSRSNPMVRLDFLYAIVITSNNALDV